MLKHRDQILLQGQAVFTQLSFETPLKESLDLPSDACYLYIERGNGQMIWRPGNITATPGTTILSTCGMTVSKLISEQEKGPMDTTIVHFNQELLEKVFEGAKPQLWEELQKPVNRYVVQESANELVRLYFDSIHSLFQHKAALSETLLALKLKEIVLLLLQSDKSEAIRQIVKSLFSERSFSFKEMVDAHLLSAASVENLAQLTHCSLSTFKRKFKEIYQSPPAQYILTLRLEKVAESLRTSDEQISHIGYELGFESPEHLSRSFKKHFGLSPSTYRMNHSVK